MVLHSQPWIVKFCTTWKTDFFEKEDFALFESKSFFLVYLSTNCSRVSYCDSAVSIVLRASYVVDFLACVRSRGLFSCPIIMKLGQNVCLDQISDKFKNWSCPVIN